MLKALAADALLLRYRTVVWVICALTFVAIGVLAVQSVREMAPPTAAQLEEAEQAYQSRMAEWQAEHEQWEQMCIEDGGSPAQCTVPAPSRESYQPWQAGYAEATGAAILMAAALLGMMMYVVGALYVGGDFASGAMSTWLSHQPRRGVLWVSKLVTMGYLALCGSLFVFTILLVVCNIAARGWAVPIEDGQWGRSLVSAGRGTLLVFLSALMGTAASFITRRASLAIGLAAAYLILNRLTVSFNIAVGAVPAMDLITQGQAWVSGGMSLAFWEGGVFREMNLHPSLGGVAWGVVTILMLIASFVLHRRRDLP